MKIFTAIFCWLAISVSCGGAQTQNIIPVTYDMNASGPFTLTVDGSDYHSPTPYTPHTLTLWASIAHKRAAYAVWRVIWSVDAPTPGYETAIVRLFTRTPDASAPKIAVKWLNSSLMRNPGFNNVSNDGIDVTTEFNNFLNAGAYGHFGWDWAGDNQHPVKFWNVQLEVGWIDQ